MSRITSQVCVNKFCRVLYEHEGTTQSLAFTPDSQYLVSACSLEILKVWYVEDLVNTTTDSCTAVCRLDNVHDLGIVCMDISKHIEINGIFNKISYITAIDLCSNFRKWSINQIL